MTAVHEPLSAGKWVREGSTSMNTEVVSPTIKGIEVWRIREPGRVELKSLNYAILIRYSTILVM